MGEVGEVRSGDDDEQLAVEVEEVKEVGSGDDVELLAVEVGEVVVHVSDPSTTQVALASNQGVNYAVDSRY